jgi:hypothetical protein
MNDKQTLTLEAGKYYRTRAGMKAYISGATPDGFANDDADGKFAGFINGVGARSWSEDGTYIEGGEDGYDLVAEWVEPKRIKGWVNVYSAGHSESPYGNSPRGGVYSTKEEANRSVLYGVERIACIEIDVLEGCGLNGEAA